MTAAALAATARALVAPGKGILAAVEPEILMDGDHTIEHCATATEDTNRDAAQAAFLHRARMNAEARQGSYRPDLEKETVRV